ncbi:NAD(P)H-dependent glycerol-3-phosphate dehydrogenase [Chitinimonas sp. BJB300]|uniref:NAD(P)H-dependent glycerol-3-phosphate dehydrogenase n=1 Tax=Chitinimonas sp. BJB300 TaxID=1559339 RepID=UPI000C0D3A30|nr:NAD(P)H-dependent glycerol-3-phosphate dehydrogenase [Chitinimonas sp. BJB300]PHV10322.1 glycerol-3-phosphate dehydrogenase [Chitinimonas sp. BJB300]TSJ91626.1 NAD(P)-dependent glycerol-3-phosphate dehydrogenase [Chitinimonas sp. BJB300]
MKLAVLGAGAWGTALAMSFARHHDVTLWGRDAGQIQVLKATGENSRYLAGLRFPANLQCSASLADATRDTELILVVTPTAGLRDTLRTLASLGRHIPILWACKGLEADTQLLAHEVAAAELPEDVPCGSLTGPSFAQEVATGLPAALTLAAEDEEFAGAMAAKLHSSRLRIYSSNDIIGAEIGGAVKNIMAIATGVSDGLQLGNNARAALITRGLAEITRFGVALGARPETFTGLSGMGDLILTCTGDLSRNRKVGLLLAQGKPLTDIIRDLGHVAEGVNTAKAVLGQAQRIGVEMPITKAVCAMLFENLATAEAIKSLMGRETKQEAA